MKSESFFLWAGDKVGHVWMTWVTLSPAHKKSSHDFKINGEFSPYFPREYKVAQREIRYLISRCSMEGREIRSYIITRSSIMKGETMFQKKKKIIYCNKYIFIRKQLLCFHVAYILITKPSEGFMVRKLLLIGYSIFSFSHLFRQSETKNRV